MAKSTVNLDVLFQDVYAQKIPVFKGGKDVIEYTELEESEKNAIRQCINDGVELLARISPKLANDFRKHEPFFMKLGGIAKAKMDNKPITYPGESGSIGVGFLIPQAIKYTTTTPTDFANNLWQMSVTAGATAYILGSDTAFYRTNSTEGSRHIIGIIKNGLIEIGTSPSFNQFKIISQAMTKYLPWTVHPLVEQPIEPDKPIYQYNTIGAVMLLYDFGIKWTALPLYTRTPRVQLLGIFFYEEDFFTDTNFKYIS